MKKKILLVSSGAQIGGAANELLYLAERLQDNYDPIILFDKRGPLSDKCDKKRIPYIIQRYYPFRVSHSQTIVKKIVKPALLPIIYLQYLIINYFSLIILSKRINFSQISLIHTNTNRDDFGAMLAKKHDIPHIWHIREDDNVPYKCYSLRRNRFDYMNKNATKFIMISKSVENNFRKLGLNPKKMITIYDGIEIRKNFEKKYSKNGLRILILGAIVEDKGQLSIVEAINLLSKNMRDNIQIDLYGDGDDLYINKIEHTIKKNKLDNISLHSHDANISKRISEYDVGVSCAVSEGFGLSTVEYMSNKLITIVSNAGASPEIVTRGSGLIYKLCDTKDLADKIAEVYNMSENEKRILGDKAYQRAIIFSSQKNAETIEKLYGKIIK